MAIVLITCSAVRAAVSGQKTRRTRLHDPRRAGRTPRRPALNIGRSLRSQQQTKTLATCHRYCRRRKQIALFLHKGCVTPTQFPQSHQQQMQLRRFPVLRSSSLTTFRVRKTAHQCHHDFLTYVQTTTRQDTHGTGNDKRLLDALQHIRNTNRLQSCWFSATSLSLDSAAAVGKRARPYWK